MFCGENGLVFYCLVKHTLLPFEPIRSKNLPFLTGIFFL